MFGNREKRKILWIGVALVVCFTACKGSSPKQMQQEDATNAVRMDNSSFFDMMKPYLNDGYTVKMVPAGNSMLPTIHHNEDVVFLKKTQEVKTGDIILAEIEKDHYVMHRVLKMEGAILTLKGDNNQGTEKTRTADVVGKVVGIKKGEAKVKGINANGRVDVDDTYCKTSSLRLDIKGTTAIMVDTVGHMVDMHRVVTFNETAKTIWDEMENLEGFTLQDMVDVVTDQYDIDKQTAYDDCKSLIQEWLTSGLVEKKVIRP